MSESARSKQAKSSVKLSPDELAALDEGIRSANSDRRYTLEEALEFALIRRKKELSIGKIIR